MAIKVVGRGRKFTLERDPAWEPGRFRATVTIHDQHYHDGSQWQPVVEETLADATVPGYTRRADQMAHVLRIGNGSERRWYPRRNVATEYVDWGVPEYWRTAGGGSWRTLPLGTVNHLLKESVWENASIKAELIPYWKGIRKTITLKAAPPANRMRWPYALVGLHWDGWKLVSNAESVAVGYLQPISARDSDGSDPETGGKALPCTTTNTGTAVEFTVNLTGAVYPVVVDPDTLTLQPDATAGIDTGIYSAYPTINDGVGVQYYLAEVSGNIARILIKFDLTDLPSTAVISSATLTLRVAGNTPSAMTVRVYRQKIAWVEGTKTWGTPADGATWNTYDGTNNWTAAGAFHADDCEQTDIGSLSVPATPITPFFYDWALSPTTKAGLDLGNGWLIRGDSDAGGSHEVPSSDDANAASRPKLVIEYTTGRTVSNVTASLSQASAAVSRTVTTVTAALSAITRRSVATVTAALSLAGIKRTASTVTAALSWARTRTVGVVTTVLQSTTRRAVDLVTASLSQAGVNIRTVTNVTASLWLRSGRIATNVTAALIRSGIGRTATTITAAILRASRRTVQLVTTALQYRATRTALLVTAALARLGNSRTVTTIRAALYWTASRTITLTTAAILRSGQRVVLTVTAAILQSGIGRTVQTVTAALSQSGIGRTVTTLTAALYSRMERTVADLTAVLQWSRARTVALVTCALSLVGYAAAGPVRGALAEVVGHTGTTFEQRSITGTLTEVLW